MIRGYEEIKLRNVMLFRKRAKALRRRLLVGEQPRGQARAAAQ